MTNENSVAGVKLEWIRPELQRIEAGSAESAEGSTLDGGGADQSS